MWIPFNISKDDTSAQHRTISGLKMQIFESCSKKTYVLTVTSKQYLKSQEGLFVFS